MFTKLVILVFATQILEPHAQGDEPPPSGAGDGIDEISASVQVDARGVTAGAVEVSRKRSARSEKRQIHQHRSLSVPDNSDKTFRLGYSELYYSKVPSGNWPRTTDPQYGNYWLLQARVAGALLAMACYGGAVPSTKCPSGPAARTSTDPHVEMVVTISDYGSDNENIARGKEIADGLINKVGNQLKLFSNFDSATQVGERPKLFMQKPVTFRDGSLSSDDMTETAQVLIGSLSAGMEHALFENATLQSHDVETLEQEAGGNSSYDIKFFNDRISKTLACDNMAIRKSMNGNQKITMIVSEGRLGFTDIEDYGDCEHVDIVMFDGWKDMTASFAEVFPNATERNILESATWIVHRYFSYYWTLKYFDSSTTAGLKVLELGSSCKKKANLDNGSGPWGTLEVICEQITASTADPLVSDSNFKDGLIAVDGLMSATGSLSKDDSWWPGNDGWAAHSLSAAVRFYKSLTKVFDEVKEHGVVDHRVKTYFDQERENWNKIGMTLNVSGSVGDFLLNCTTSSFNQQPTACTCTCTTCIQLESTTTPLCSR